MVLSGIVTTVTTLSMSAVATNGQMAGGGAYYLISRNLGPQMGGSIGILFSIGSSVAISLYIIGFAETLVDILHNMVGFQLIAGDALWDIRVYGIGALTILFIMALIGVGWIVKVLHSRQY